MPRPWPEPRGPCALPPSSRAARPAPYRRSRARRRSRCEDSIGCMHGSSEPDLRNWKSPIPQFTQGARPDEH
ncbi:hypothetical protein, partial [Bordetella pertussis]|uniref:hypothetical protein n=1 Tax=Bordetella pertussis TaxID=520 RepID=UPI00366F903B